MFCDCLFNIPIYVQLGYVDELRLEVVNRREKFQTLREASCERDGSMPFVPQSLTSSITKLRQWQHTKVVSININDNSLQNMLLYYSENVNELNYFNTIILLIPLHVITSLQEKIFILYNLC